MRYVLVVVLFVAAHATVAMAADYYVSTDGTGSATGTINDPFGTIQAAANVAQAGDRVIVRGGTYRETVTVNRSGTSGAPIRFEAYAGELVTVAGLDQFSGSWSNYNGSVYQATTAAPVTQVFVDRQAMNRGRWPNPEAYNPLRAQRYRIESQTIPNNGTGAVTITDSRLPNGSSFSDAKIAILSGGEWVTFNSTVDTHSNQNLSFNWSRTDSSQVVRQDNPYYLYGSRDVVDAPREWYHDSGSNTLYFAAPDSGDPTGQNVEVRTRNDGFVINNHDHIEVSGMQFVAANIVVRGDNNTIDNVQVLHPNTQDSTTPNIAQGHPWGYSAPDGVTLQGQFNTIRNSEIGHAAGDAVTLKGTNNTVENNVIHNANHLGTGGAFVDTENRGDNTIKNNTMYNAGRSGVTHRFNAPNTEITHSDISRFAMLTEDNGGIYTWGNSWNSSTNTGEGTVIAYNKVHEADTRNKNAGIYLDNYSDGADVHHNLVFDTDIGVRVNKPSENSVIANNTLMDVSRNIDGQGGNPFENIVIANNISDKSTSFSTNVNNGIDVGDNAFNVSGTGMFVNAAAGDYRLLSSLESDPTYQGRVIAGITDGYNGANPEVGAFEIGAEAWTAGASFTSWIAPNQTDAPLTDAVSVARTGGARSTGDLIVDQWDNTAGSISFLKFDMLQIETEREIESAVLRLYQKASPDYATGNMVVRRVTSEWTTSDVIYWEQS